MIYSKNYLISVFVIIMFVLFIGRFILMTGEIIAVGTELLLGDILNTNAQYLSRQLAALGIGVYFQSVVGDNKDRLLNAFENDETESKHNRSAISVNETPFRIRLFASSVLNFK